MNRKGQTHTKVIEPFVEIITPIDYDAMLRHIEQCGRTCYKSEHKITEGSAERFIRNIIKRGHESVLEHASFTVRWTVDRSISHQIVRHRIASYSQESQRYCVAGDMILKTANPHNNPSVESLYNNMLNSKNGSWKRVTIEQYDELSGTLIFSKIKGIYKIGEKECISVKTRLGYEIVCTADHLILTDNGYRQAGELSCGDHIMVNGTEDLYKNKDWLYNQNITLDKSFAEISREFGFGVSVLKKWARAHGIPKKGKGYYNTGRIPWNNGVVDDRQVSALRKYHHCGRRPDRILKEDTCKYIKHRKDACEICGSTNNIDVHHLDCNRANNDPKNLITLCQSCHMRVHSKNLLAAYPDEVVSVCPVGEKTVYDISMDSENHNFVANGVIVHNCNYGKDDFGGDVTFVRPVQITEDTPAFAIWQTVMQKCECAYFDMLTLGCSPQEARSVLPNSTKTELIMTANIREWRHFLKLRTSEGADPNMRHVANLLLKLCKFAMPALFDDIGMDGDGIE